MWKERRKNKETYNISKTIHNRIDQAKKKKKRKETPNISLTKDNRLDQLFSRK